MKFKKVKLLLVFIFVSFIILSNIGTANAALVIPELWERVANTYLKMKTATWNLGAPSAHIPAGYFDNIYADNAVIGTITISTASEGAFTIDVTDPEAFLVRVDGDANDLFIVDTTNFNIENFGQVIFSSPYTTSTLAFFNQDYDHISIDIDSEATSVTGIRGDFQNTSGDLFNLGVNGSERIALDYLGNLDIAGDLTIAGDDLIMGTNTAGFILKADGTNFNPVLDIDVDSSYISAPVVEDFDEFYSFMKDITIIRVWCWTDTGTATLNIENASDADVLSSDIVCDADGQSACASGCDVDTINTDNDNLAAYAEGDVSISAVASDPTKLSLFIGYTIDN